MSTPPSFDPQPCCDSAADASCGQPVQFCQTGSTTAPAEHPGRMYDLTLPINQGFAVESMNVGAVNSPANIIWEVDDPDGEKFRVALTSFMESRLPAAAVVAITNPNAGLGQPCAAALPMQIHIECLRLDQSPPDLVELLYNGGQDMIQNPAYNENPPLNPPVADGNYGFHLLSRQDDPGPFPGNQPSNDALCTSVAGRGWETNDVGRTFEIWGKDVAGGVTPTPRGTPVQEITSDGPPAGGVSTIWQTFQAPASGDFKIRIVHGGRDAGEHHIIALKTGDTDADQSGGLIHDETNPLAVYSGNPWTQFNQTVPLTGGQTYTLSLSSTNPVGGARGGLFTDMRAYIDRPGQRATATTDDETCTVTVTETTTTTTCSFWQTQCTAGEITGWRRVDNGLTLTNAQFWAQVPTPSCCTTQPPEGDGGGSTLSNLAVSDVVCAVSGGMPQNAIRQVVLDPSGGQLSQTFLSTDGAPISPDSWTPGPCTTQRYLQDVLLCETVTDGFGDVTTNSFVRKYVQTWTPEAGAQVTEIRDFNLDGSVRTIVGTVGACEIAPTNVDQEPACWTQTDTGAEVHVGTIRHDDSYPPPGWVLLDQNTAPVLANTPGLTFVPCGVAADPMAVTGLCLADGTPIAAVVRRDADTGAVTEDGWINLTTGAFTAGNPPVGTVACGESRSIQVTGVFCDLDGGGNVLGLVLIEYSYNPDGTIASVRLVNATTGATYTPSGTISVCPSGTDTGPEQDVVVLCDVNAGASTPFVRDYRRDSTGAITAVSNYTLAGAPYTPTGTVGACSDRDVETMVLCDVPLGVGLVNTFWRTWVYNPDGSVASVIDRDQSGDPYTVSSGGLVTDCGGIDSEQQVLCDVSGGGVSTQFLRTEVRQGNAILRRVDTQLDGVSPYTPTGTVGLCSGLDAESVILCDTGGSGARFLRSYRYNASGAVSGFSDTTLAGAAFTPSGTVTVCTTTVQSDTDFVEEVLCDVSGAGVSTAFIRLFRFNSATGALISTTNTTLAGAAYTPAGTVGACSDCCPQVVGNGCSNTGSGFYTAIRATSGTISLIDSVSGAAITAGNIVPCPSGDTPVTLTAQGRLVGDADTAWTPGGDVTGTLTSVTLTVLTGTATVTDQSGTVLSGLPAGYTATWTVADENTLTGPQSIDAVGGNTVVVWTQRP